MSKVNGNNRTSALKRLTQASSVGNSNRRQMIGLKSSSVNDARQLLGNRNKSSFDARQLLNRQASNTFKTVSTSVTIRKNLVRNEAETDDNNGKMVLVTGLKDLKMKDGRLISTATAGSSQSEKKNRIFTVGPSTFVTVRNNNMNTTSTNQITEKISLTKTITNPSVRRDDDNNRSQATDTPSSLSNKKVVISFVNDKYQKAPQPIPTTTATNSFVSPVQHYQSPPMIKRSHDASIQTTPPSSSSRSPIRMSTHRRPATVEIDEQNRSTSRTINDDLYEPPVKRTTSSVRKTATETEQQALSVASSSGSVKRTSSGAPIASKITSSSSTVSKPISTPSSQSTPGTILVTNLVSSVTEDDIIELFDEIGSINAITTLSAGCVQITFNKREHATQAVTKYHNRLLDGQFMYVSLQQTPPSSTKQTPKATNNTQQPTKETGPTNSASSTTTAANQPLKFNTTTTRTSNKIAIDPAFIRQALFHPSNNTTNPVQFQVKL